MKTRAKALEYLKSAREKGTVQDLTLCLKHDDFLNVNFLHINGTCPGEVHPSSQQLDAHLICRQGIAQTFKLGRVDPENINGTMEQMGTPQQPATINQTIVGKWLGQDCRRTIKDRLQSAGIASGANKHVLSFLPYLPETSPGFLGNYFSNSWDSRNPGIPSIAYNGGFPGAPRPESLSETYFHGTDGSFLTSPLERTSISAIRTSAIRLTDPGT